MEKDQIRSTIYLSPEQHERLRRESYETREPQAAIIRRALEEYFKGIDGKKPGK